MYILHMCLHTSVPMNAVLFNVVDYDTILNLCTVFLCLRSHLLRLIITFEALIDRMIDIPCQIMT